MKTTIKNIKTKVGLSLVIVGAAALVLLPTHNKARATGSSYVGAHSATNSGDVYLGGNFLELGVSKRGSFGTHGGYTAPGFHSMEPAGPPGTGGRIGILTNPTGFEISPDLTMDFSLPGTPEERWSVGYSIEDSQFYGSNSMLDDFSVSPGAGGGPGPAPDGHFTGHDISTVATNHSSSARLQANVDGTFRNTLKVSQVISFGVNDKFFKNVITLKNVSAGTVGHVRYLRSMDSDNTKFQGGIYDTHNQVLYTQADGDNMAVVSADTSNNSEDPVFLANGTRSPIMFISGNPSARVSYGGFINGNPYDPNVYDSPAAKGTFLDDDQAITIAFDGGSLTPGQSVSFTYYTSVDNRGPVTAINMIRCGKLVCPRSSVIPN